MRIEPRSLGAAGSPGGDFAVGTERALHLFPPEALAVGVSHPERRPRPARLRAEIFGCSSPAARTRLGEILGGRGRLVTTGQQPGLFLGPLYVLYKSLTAIELARRLEAASGAPALACFWIASDDHDWQEIAVSRLLDREGSRVEIRLTPPPGDERRAVGPAPLPPDVVGALERLREVLPASEFVEDYLELLRRAYQPGRPFADAFAEVLPRVVGKQDFCWLDAATPGVKQASTPLFEQALGEHARFEEAVAVGTEAVQGAGYAPQLKHVPGATLLFMDLGAGRERLYVRNGIVSGREGTEMRLDEARARLHAKPDAVSPSAALRPVLESWLLPVGATVLGPGEIAYWAQLPQVFAAAGVPMPAIEPRFAWMALEARVARLLDELGVGPEDLRDGGGALARSVVERQRPEALRGALTELRQALGSGLDRVEDVVGRELPGIRSAAGKARKAAFDAVRGLEHTIDHRIRERQESRLEQIARAAAQLFPGGKPQERVLSPFYFLARYGAGFTSAVAEAGGSQLLRTLVGVAGVDERE
ncbi:MAG: bacillithiol biosynthesis cysteine-adding enzyme BshC [Gemmatimonadota bacterium]